jgi:hypothetical protein
MPPGSVAHVYRSVRYPDTGLSLEADIGCDPTTQMNPSQALPVVLLEGVRWHVQSLGAGMRRQGYLDLRNSLTAYPLAALAERAAKP